MQVWRAILSASSSLELDDLELAGIVAHLLLTGRIMDHDMAANVSTCAVLVKISGLAFGTLVAIAYDIVAKHAALADASTENGWMHTGLELLPMVFVMGLNTFAALGTVTCYEDQRATLRSVASVAAMNKLMRGFQIDAAHLPFCI